VPLYVRRTKLAATASLDSGDATRGCGRTAAVIPDGFSSRRTPSVAGNPVRWVHDPETKVNMIQDSLPMFDEVPADVR